MEKRVKEVFTDDPVIIRIENKEDTQARKAVLFVTVGSDLSFFCEEVEISGITYRSYLSAITLDEYLLEKGLKLMDENEEEIRGYRERGATYLRSSWRTVLTGQVEKVSQAK